MKSDDVSENFCFHCDNKYDMLTVLAAAQSLSFTHGVFHRDHTRQLAHRWRPIPDVIEPDAVLVVGNNQFVPASGEGLWRYSRALGALESHKRSYGLMAEDGELGMCLFVLHIEDSASSDASSKRRHVLDAILWHPRTSKRDREVAMRAMRLWHLRCLGKSVNVGKDVVV